MKLTVNIGGDQKRKLIRIFVICLALFVTLLLLYKIKPAKHVTLYCNSTINGLMQYHDEDDPVTQTLFANHHVSSFSFRIATFTEVHDVGSLVVTVTNPETDELLTSKKFETESLLDNTWLTVETDLEPGQYLITFDFINLAKDKPMLFYTTSEMQEHCFVNGRETNYAVFLDVQYSVNRADSIPTVRIVTLAILLAVALGLIFTQFYSYHGFKSESRSNILKMVAAFLCLAAIAVVVNLEYGKMVGSGSAEFLRNNRWEFYGLVALYLVFVYLLADRFPWICWLTAVLIAAVWIFTDIKYSAIDEAAHTQIIQYLLTHRFRFPLVSENYEAVQGPIYYYIVALLSCWLPRSLAYMGGRVFGIACLLLFALLSRKTVEVLKKAQVLRISSRLENTLWLLFFTNPLLLIRFTRASNEALVPVFVAAVVYLLTQVILGSFDSWKIWLATVFCALAFLTKATSVFVFGLVFLACAYHKKWLMFLWQTLLYLALLAPWFISNYQTYGALTGMQGHLDFVLPIVNPDLKQPDLWDDLLHYFRHYFLNVESGYRYDYLYFDNFVMTLAFLLLCSSLFVAVPALWRFLKGKLKFTYLPEERKSAIFLSYTALPVVMLVMHAFQSVATLNNSMNNNRYGMLLNGVFCAMLLFGAQKLSGLWNKLVSGFVCFFYAFSIISMVCGYIEIVSTIF